jgi:actin-related protein 9
MLKIPDYFAEYRERGDVLAAFLGACIVAKARFSFSTFWSLLTP